MRALIVHDRADVAAAIHELVFKELGCPIDIVGDVFAAKERMRQCWYDLAIVDLTLPVIARLNEPRLE